MCICDRSKTDFNQVKLKLTGQFDRRHSGHYFELWMLPIRCVSVRLTNRIICLMYANSIIGSAVKTIQIICRMYSMQKKYS